MSVSRTSNKSTCIEPSELIVDVKFIDIWEGPPGPNGYSGSRHSFYFKIYKNGNVIISSNNGFFETERLRVNDNIPIPQFLVNVITSLLWKHVEYNTSNAGGRAPDAYGGGYGNLYLGHLCKMVQIVDLIKSEWRNEKSLYELRINLRDGTIKTFRESNKNLSEENIIITNKNDIYEKHLNELQESVKKLYKLLFFLLLTLSVVPLICLRYFCE